MDLVNARPAKDHKKGRDIRQLTDYINFFDDKASEPVILRSRRRRRISVFATFPTNAGILRWRSE